MYIVGCFNAYPAETEKLVLGYEPLAQVMVIGVPDERLGEVGCAFALDRAVRELVDGELSGADAAKVKLFCTETQARAVDRCLQLFGGYGYMLEYPIARLYADARIPRIYAGTSEVMKVIIAKSLGL
jgi:alkylation response protein AidB-like acyl-CoA dehydrogenase